MSEDIQREQTNVVETSDGRLSASVTTILKPDYIELPRRYKLKSLKVYFTIINGWLGMYEWEKKLIVGLLFFLIGMSMIART